MPTDTLTTQVTVDNSGPVFDAVLMLITVSVLGDHVTADADKERGVVTVRHLPDDVPYDMWGSGAQHLWLLLLSFAHRGNPVDLYSLVAHLDGRNRQAVALAMVAFCA